MRRSDSLPPSRRTRFPSLGGTTPVRLLFVSPCRSDADRRAGSVAVWPPPSQLVSVWRRSGSPKVPGEPSVPLPCSPTPAGPPRQAVTSVWLGPRCTHGEGSPREVISGLHHTASGLAVYASQCGIAPAPRKTRFRLLAKLCRTGLVTRRVPTKGFHVRPTSRSLLSQACPGARVPPQPAGGGRL
jgi:hypothetical protein